MKASALTVAAGALIGLSACGTYSVRKSALAPHLAPPMRSGHGTGQGTEVSFGSTTVAAAVAPEEGPGANAGLHIPRAELGGALRGALSPNFDFGFLWDYGARRGATKTAEDEPSPQNGSVWGGGISMFYSAPTPHPAFRLGLGLDLLRYSVPYVEYRTCVEDCVEPYTDVDHDREGVNVYSLSVIPSWRVGGLTLFGGGTLRNHPMVDKGEIEIGTYPDDEVNAGPPNLIATVGAEIELFGSVRALGMVYQPLTQDPVRYGPTFGAAITIPLGSPMPAPPARVATR